MNGAARTAAERTPLVHYWHERELPKQVQVTLASFREHNPEMDQLVFDEASATALIGTRFGAREAAAFKSCAVPAMQSDYFRYCAVHALGGIYADANFHCRDGLGRLLDEAEKAFFFGRQDPVPDDLAAAYGWPRPVRPFWSITNGLFGLAKSRSPLLGMVIRAATANLEYRVADGPVGVWVSAGPGVLTSLYLLHRLGSFDAFLKFSVGSIVERSAPLLCEVVDDFAEIEAAWDGMDIRPLGERQVWAVKSTEARCGSRWATVSGSIYRDIEASR